MILDGNGLAEFTRKMKEYIDSKFTPASEPITDLTNTTWQFNSQCNYFGDGSTTKAWDINYESNNYSYYRIVAPMVVYGNIACTGFLVSNSDGNICYLNTTDTMYSGYNVTDGTGWYSNTKVDNQLTFNILSTPPTITITGGTDVTNIDLINWLQENATKVIN